MKKMLALMAILLMACGSSPTEPEIENPYNVQCEMFYDPSFGRVCNLTWDAYDGEDFLAYAVAFEESSTGWLITEEPILNPTITSCFSFPDVYEGHVPDKLYFRIVTWKDGIIEEVEFVLIPSPVRSLN